MNVANPPSAALATATALTIVVWLTPLARAVVSSVKSRRLVLGALDSASGVVRITYGSAFAALLLVAFRPITTRPFTLSKQSSRKDVGDARWRLRVDDRRRQTVNLLAKPSKALRAIPSGKPIAALTSEIETLFRDSESLIPA